MAGEAERDPGSLEELLRRAAGVVGGDRQGIAFFPIVFGVVRATAEGTAPELERVFMLNPVIGGMVMLEGDPALLSELLPPGLAAGGGPPPASRASIEAMSSVEPSEEGADVECPVCLDGLRSGGGETASDGVVKEMPCGHRFHGGCIEKWLGMHGSCPMCRYRMPAEEEDPKKAGEEAERGRELVITVAFGRRDEGVDGQQQQQGEQQGEQQDQVQERQEQEEQREDGEAAVGNAMEAID